MEPTNKVLLGPSNYKIKCSGKFTGELSVNNETLNEEIYVVKGLQTPLLGRVASSKLKLIQKVDHIKLVKIIPEGFLRVIPLCLLVLENKRVNTKSV